MLLRLIPWVPFPPLAHPSLCSHRAEAIGDLARILKDAFLSKGCRDLGWEAGGEGACSFAHNSHLFVAGFQKLLLNPSSL